MLNDPSYKNNYTLPKVKDFCIFEAPVTMTPLIGISIIIVYWYKT
jgi:hypothetical protein